MTLRRTAEDHIPRPSPGSLGPVGENTWAERVACPRCAATELHRCTDASGAKRSAHAARVRAARAAGLAPVRGRPRELEGEAKMLSFRAGAAEEEAIARYQAEHPGAGRSEAVRGIMAEWLEDRS